MKHLPGCIAIPHKIISIIVTTGMGVLMLYMGGLTILILLEELVAALQGDVPPDYDVPMLIIKVFTASLFFVGAGVIYAAIKMTLELRSKKRSLK